MDPGSLQAALAVGLLAGFLFSFNPVALAAIPVSLGYVTRAGEPRRTIPFGGMFVIGMVVTHALLGLIAGLGGGRVQQLFGRAWGLALGPLLIVLGAVWLGWPRNPDSRTELRGTTCQWRLGRVLAGRAILGGGVPGMYATLLIMLCVSAAIGSALYGLAMLVAFAVSRAVPILIGAAAFGWVGRLKPLHGAQNSFEHLGGIVLMPVSTC